MIKLPKNVEFIISRLEAFGHRADIVGGCVRDRLLDKEPNDYDITTDATPDRMREIFSDMRTIDTGIKHGTLTVIINSLPYEITTYRLDGEYSDNRHPDKVSFTRCIADDLSRRDFTVNAMCYSNKNGFTDLFGGKDDLRAKIIRAVGDPERRFTEDALRILRALRFASVLDFNIEENTSLAIRKKSELLKNVSKERIYAEWKKLVGGIGAYRILAEYKDVIAVIIPQLSSFTLPDERLFSRSDADIRELSLFADGGSRAFLDAMSLLKCDNKHKNYGASVLENLNLGIDTETDMKLLLIKVGEDRAKGIIKLKILLGLSDSESLYKLENLLKNGVCYRISDIKIDGNDLAALGLKGKEIGDILTRLLVMIAENKVDNERESLLGAVANLR
jgi:tRNA nucleotidyltransferase (CCA-adding enzyme)